MSTFKIFVFILVTVFGTVRAEITLLDFNSPAASTHMSSVGDDTSSHSSSDQSSDNPCNDKCHLSSSGCGCNFILASIPNYWELIVIQIEFSLPFNIANSARHASGIYRPPIS